MAAYRDKVFFLASALSFNALLAAIPFAMLVIALLGYLLESPGGAAEEIVATLRFVLPDREVLGDDPLARAEQAIGSVIASREEFSRLGIPLFLLFSTRLFRSARIALDEILGPHERRRWFFGLARDVVLVLLTTTLFATVAVLTIPAISGSIWEVMISNVLAVAFSTLLFFLLYSLAPSRKLRRETTVIAAILAAFAFEAAKILYGIYLSEFATTSQLVSHANALALLLFVAWVYYTAALFLLGGEFAKAYEGFEHRA